MEGVGAGSKSALDVFVAVGRHQHEADDGFSLGDCGKTNGRSEDALLLENVRYVVNLGIVADEPRHNVPFPSDITADIAKPFAQHSGVGQHS